MAFATKASFPLMKASLATDPTASKSISWKHETRDIHLLFDNYGAIVPDSSTPSILTIFQGSTTLERVNVALKAREAEDVFQRAQETGKQLNTQLDVPLEVLYGRANRVIAVRYRLSTTNTRRMQMRFESDRDFEHALSILEQLGCRPREHPSQARGSSSSARPQSRPVAPREFIDAQRPNTTTPRLLDQDQVTSSHFRPSTAAMPGLPQASSFTFQAPLVDTRRPTSALDTIREDRAIHQHDAFQNDPIMQNIGGFDSASQREPFARRATDVRPYTTATSAGRSLPDALGNRDQTRPLSTGHDFKLEIPPRRELPFKRPGSRASLTSRDGAANRPATSNSIVDYLPELPQPNFINPPLIESTDMTKKRTMPTKKSEDARPANKQATRPASSAKKQTTRRPATPAAKKSAAARAADRPLTALSTSSANIKASDSTLPTSDTLIDPASPILDVRSALHRVDKAMAGLTAADTGRTEEQDALAGYADMAYNERMAVLEKMIVEMVDNENFITLCEDVQSCWQRIGFGR